MTKHLLVFFLRCVCLLIFSAGTMASAEIIPDTAEGFIAQLQAKTKERINAVRTIEFEYSRKIHNGDGKETDIARLVQRDPTMLFEGSYLSSLEKIYNIEHQDGIDTPKEYAFTGTRHEVRPSSDPHRIAIYAKTQGSFSPAGGNMWNISDTMINALAKEGLFTNIHAELVIQNEPYIQITAVKKIPMKAGGSQSPVAIKMTMSFDARSGVLRQAEATHDGKLISSHKVTQWKDVQIDGVQTRIPLTSTTMNSDFEGRITYVHSVKIKPESVRFNEEIADSRFTANIGPEDTLYDVGLDVVLLDPQGKNLLSELEGTAADPVPVSPTASMTSPTAPATTETETLPAAEVKPVVGEPVTTSSLLTFNQWLSLLGAGLLIMLVAATACLRGLTTPRIATGVVAATTIFLAMTFFLQGESSGNVQSDPNPQAIADLLATLNQKRETSFPQYTALIVDSKVINGHNTPYYLHLVRRNHDRTEVKTFYASDQSQTPGVTDDLKNQWGQLTLDMVLAVEDELPVYEEIVLKGSRVNVLGQGTFSRIERANISTLESLMWSVVDEIKSRGQTEKSVLYKPNDDTDQADSLIGIQYEKSEFGRKSAHWFNPAQGYLLADASWEDPYSSSVDGINRTLKTVEAVQRPDGTWEPRLMRLTTSFTREADNVLVETVILRRIIIQPAEHQP